MRRDHLACAILIKVVLRVLCAVRVSLQWCFGFLGRDTHLTAGVTQFRARVAAVHLRPGGLWLLVSAGNIATWWQRLSTATGKRSTNGPQDGWIQLGAY